MDSVWGEFDGRWDRDEPGGFALGFIRSEEEEARIAARDAWCAAWAGIEIPVPWEFDGKTGVSIFLVDHSGITDQWGNFYCDPPDPLTRVGDIEAIAAYIVAQPDRGEE